MTSAQRPAFIPLKYGGLISAQLSPSRWKMMAILRAVLIVTTLLFFFVVVTPFQVIAIRLNLPVAAFGQMALCRALLFLLRVEILGMGEPSPARPRLIIANHVSWIDILVFGAIEPVCFLAKREVSLWPVLASFPKAQRTVFLDRKRPRSIPGANRAMAARMSEKRSVILFPEATTCDGMTLGKFHSSHVAAARDLLSADPKTGSVFIQPAAIFYSSPHAVWTGDATLLPHLWEVLRSAPLQVGVAFGEPLAYERGGDRKILCAAAKVAIAELLREHQAEVDYGSQSVPARSLEMRHAG